MFSILPKLVSHNQQLDLSLYSLYIRNILLRIKFYFENFFYLELCPVLTYDYILETP
jgi:hypothetical protein